MIQATRRVPMRAVQIELLCKCGGTIGFVPFGKTKPTMPPKIEHKCAKCGETSWQSDSYPKIEFEALQ